MGKMRIRCDKVRQHADFTIRELTVQPDKVFKIVLSILDPWNICLLTFLSDGVLPLLSGDTF